MIARRPVWFLLLLSLAGCRERAAPAGTERSVVVYSSADKEFAELVFKAYEQKTA